MKALSLFKELSMSNDPKAQVSRQFATTNTCVLTWLNAFHDHDNALHHVFLPDRGFSILKDCAHSHDASFHNTQCRDYHPKDCTTAECQTLLRFGLDGGQLARAFN